MLQGWILCAFAAGAVMSTTLAYLNTLRQLKTRYLELAVTYNENENSRKAAEEQAQRIQTQIDQLEAGRKGLW